MTNSASTPISDIVNIFAMISPVLPETNESVILEYTDKTDGIKYLGLAE